jgi:RIO kinase 1
VKLGGQEASRLFKRVLRNIEVMLAAGRVHGDLSAFNILYWQGEIYLIDFPQVIRPAENRNAFRIFERDVRRVCEYFTHQGVECSPARLAAGLWTAHGNRISPEVHPRLLNEDDENDRAYWQSLREAS